MTEKNNRTDYSSRMQKSQYEQIEEQQLRDTDSEEQQFKSKQNQLRKTIQQKRTKRKINQKVVIGSRFAPDVGEYFKFNKDRQNSPQGRRINLIQQLSNDYASWMVLVFYLLLDATIPPWIANIRVNRLNRNSWLFFLQTFLIIPFVMYEKRTCKEEDKQKYTFKYLFTLENIRKIYFSAASLSIYQIVCWLCFDWTWICHSQILGGLANFFLSVVRTYNAQNHRLQPGGQILIILGIICVLIDSYTYTLVRQDIPDSYYQYLGTRYLIRQGYQRLVADIIAIVVAYIVAQLSKLSVDIKGNLPPFLSIMCVNAFVCINTAFAGFFLVGNDFDFTQTYGWFSLFTNSTFPSFLFECTIISFGLFMSFGLIAKLYPNPTIPSMVLVFNPFVSAFFIEICGVQHMPGSFSTFGFMLIIPGKMIILVGQYIYIQVQKEQQIEEIKKLQAMVSQHEIKRQTRARSKIIRQQLKSLRILSMKRSQMQSGIGSPQNKGMESPQRKAMEYPEISNLYLNSMNQIIQQGRQSGKTNLSDQSVIRDERKQRKKTIKMQSLNKLYSNEQVQTKPKQNEKRESDKRI